MNGGLGAECHGSQTGGPWNRREQNLHINILELIAAELGLHSYLKHKENVSVHLLMDNTTALSHLRKMRGTTCEKMIDITKRIWSYLLQKNIALTLEYIPSKLNVIAD